MTDTNQKLREALQAAEYALWVCIEHNALHHGESHNTVLRAVESRQKVLEAVALPTADELKLSDPAVQKRLAAQWGFVLPTAAPVGEREAFEELIEEFEAAAIDKHDCRNPEYEFEHRAYDTACQRYDTARSALSAGDAKFDRKVIEIVSDHLTAIGADGLVCPDAECACRLGELAPCDGDYSNCQPGWISGPSGPTQGDWQMWTSKKLAEEQNAVLDAAMRKGQL